MCETSKMPADCKHAIVNRGQEVWSTHFANVVVIRDDAVFVLHRQPVAAKHDHFAAQPHVSIIQRRFLTLLAAQHVQSKAHRNTANLLLWSRAQRTRQLCSGSPLNKHKTSKRFAHACDLRCLARSQSSRRDRKSTRLNSSHT